MAVVMVCAIFSGRSSGSRRLVCDWVTSQPFSENDMERMLLLLGDEDVVVLGLDMGDPAVAASEQGGARRFVEQVLGVCRAGARRPAMTSAAIRTLAAARRFRSDTISSRPASTPAAPSEIVIARVPISGISQKVVPSVPTMLPKVEIP